MPVAVRDSAFLQQLNSAVDAEAVALLDNIVERSGWLAGRLAAHRPYAGTAALAARIEVEVNGLSREEALVLLRAHPELAPPEPMAMTSASQAEQGRLQLLDPTSSLAARFAELNRRYLERHGYPFVIALHAQADMEAVLSRFSERLESDPEQEMRTALSEVISVMTSRLARLAGGEA